MATEEDLFAKLAEWVTDQDRPPTLNDVIRTEDGELLAAFVFRGFREAARHAVEQRFQLADTAPRQPNEQPAASPAVRIFDRLMRAWSVPDDVRHQLLGLGHAGELETLRAVAAPEIPAPVVERLAMLLDILDAVNTLLPQPPHADTWLRSSNKAALFGGRSALDVMVSRGIEGIRDVRAYLHAQIWST
jgi:hypothetical protein